MRTAKSFINQPKNVFSFGGFFALVLGVSLSLFFIAKTSPVYSQSSNTGFQVSGVENRVQYLTSLILLKPNNEKIELKYIPNPGYLYISGAINADEINIAGDKIEIKGMQGGAFFGGSENVMENTQNVVSVGGSNNRIEATSDSTIIGGKYNTIRSTTPTALRDNLKNITLFGGENNVVYNIMYGNAITIVGGSNNKVSRATGGDPVVSENIVVVGSKNTVHSQNVVVVGNNVLINDGVENVFVRNPQTLGTSGTPLPSEFAPTVSNAFYVTTQNGFLLNKTGGSAALDIAGALKMKTSTTLPFNFMTSNPEEIEGVLIYIEGNYEGNAISAFCGWDGQEWIPMSSDIDAYRLCKKARTQACIGILPQNVGDASHGGKMHGGASDSSTVTPNSTGFHTPFRDEWNDQWRKIPRNFDRKTMDFCTYECGNGYHPGGDGLDSIYVGNCFACSAVPNAYDWKSSGTGYDNCDFGCKGSYFYDSTARYCIDCDVGTFTGPDGHQDAVCSNCTPLAGSGFKEWTSNGTGEYGCNFNCLPKYGHRFVGTVGNACIECAVGTYSPGDQANCLACSGKPIDIKFKDQKNQTTYNTIESSIYTSNAATPTGCEWECRMDLGLEKIVEGDGTSSCKCKAGEHLDTISGPGECTPNTRRVWCGGTLPAHAQGVSPSIDGKFERQWNGVRNEGYWGSIISWDYYDDGSGTSNPECKRKCITGYTYDGNGCASSGGGGEEEPGGGGGPTPNP